MATVPLQGKVALVTGSGRENGIGAAIARKLAQNGASVAIHYVSEGSKTRAEKVAANLKAEFGVKTTVVQGAIQEVGVATRIVKQTLADFCADKIDILVNNAGGGSIARMMEVTPEQLQVEFSVNVFGTMYLTQAVVDSGKMPQGGRIINIGTIASKQGSEWVGIYAAAKAAQDSLTTSWAGELGKSRGITVNTVAPGPVPTDTSKPMLQNPDGSPSAAHTGLLASVRAADRLGTVDDIADAVLLLTSEESRWITAQYLAVSGGILGTM